MKKSRIIVLFLALAAAAGAFMVSGGSGSPPPTQVAAAPPPPPPATDDVLVAAKDLPLGVRVGEADLTWQSWPKDSVPPGTLRRSQNPKAVDDIKGSTARAPLYAGEPVRPEKLMKGDGGLMAVILPTGKRAVAINIDSQGGRTAGGFILPNDHVDVVRTYRPETRPGAPQTAGDAFQTETLLNNVKVLAIGQTVQEKNGQPVVVGSNATLELDPQQAETVILAQRTGQLSLVLRSVLDLHQATTGPSTSQASHGLSVVRYGNISQDNGR